ncbi:Uncharacterized protein OS=Singulisphaera acidiphila (strain ATCC BAA-1392 / DSM 18658 / VKM B-2454 / MOB10) GN=Sinac_3204 PE=4 SV=1 [Gemmataceae bacterium]|nr:Uncharacterized protein OS=Singulisphaera acidiphila (strain ATCC BAA-1392 / DSM 18658 / VKM B-2454 / MOB10) GN=Sinac_3204 PE=4 SV=1 [Gemmataceae bacterium]VTT99227.1 Uncharacterized protein OS=Singulisphaera acidiphila (strain ATCC BAA-1392 / DSM 18658 / VKM B-2454 / MOB10) GN=Sinac_3204 PE=4 SV=1 [Gemmataceae bacterium]
MQSRREFHSRLLGSAVTFGLVEFLHTRNLFADAVKPTIDKWFLELTELSKDLKGRKLTDLEFQTRMEDLYKRVDLKALCALVKLDEVEKRPLPDSGAANVGFDLSKVAGLPANLGFGKQIFGCKKGKSIVPHGHANMCTGFIVLKGKWHGKHYDRVETHKDHYVIKPTIDREFEPGELSTISDHKDNIHWFKSLTDAAYIFNVHVIGYDPTIKDAGGRLYLDPDGEKLSGGLVKAPKMSSTDCHKKYG